MKKKPTSFQYFAQDNAWMSSTIWTEFLQNWDRELKESDPILLVIDNCAAHECTVQLNKRRLLYLPPNLTSVLQPCDTGINHSIKSMYRILLPQPRLQHHDLTTQDYFALTVESLKRVSRKVIFSAFKNSGWIIPNNTTDLEESPSQSDSREDNAEAQIPFDSGALIQQEDTYAVEPWSQMEARTKHSLERRRTYSFPPLPKPTVQNLYRSLSSLSNFTEYLDIDDK